MRPIIARFVLLLLALVGLAVMVAAMFLPLRWPGIIGGATIALLSTGSVIALHIIETKEAREWPTRHRTSWRKRK